MSNKKERDARESLRFIFFANLGRDGTPEEYLDAISAITSGKFTNFDGTQVPCTNELEYIMLLKANLDDRARDEKRRKSLSKQRMKNKEQ